MSPVISLEAHRQARASDPQVMHQPVAALVYPVHSAVPGRVRYKVDPLYRSAPLKQIIERELAARVGIVSVSANVLTGTVLILFDRGRDLNALGVLLEVVVRHATGGPPVPHAAPAGNPEAPASWRERLHTLLATTAAPESRPWHQIGADEVLTALGSRRTGLTAALARKRLKQFGYNLLPEAAPRSALSMFIGQFNSLPVALLGASAVVSLATGGVADAVVILGVVLINAMIGYVTESQAE